ncbi:unnamed protein product [Clavelina lepadiformis]|uniref:Leucine-rich repeat-containing protein 49 n=1 Tax=Clavelina lepadiformis TaxID=159417 RepID=A0ABP0F351_CLALP
MYHSGKFKGRPGQAPGREQHGVHPVHLSLQAMASPVVERNVRQVTPDRLTRDQAATFRPSELPVGQGPRRSSAQSDGGSAHSFSSGPLRTIGIGPPALTHTMSETRMIGNRRNITSPSKVYAAEFAQLSAGDHFRRHNSIAGQENESSHSQESTPRNLSKLYSQQQQKNTPYLPGDRVIFAESPSAPGIPIVYRTAEERASNPDRLNLDRRRLTVCPILEGEEHLRLLNFQHNSISRIQHLSNLRRLIFLDLYDNQVEDMTGLSALKSLRVLMLGKNRIQNVSGLENLLKLDVLDLHGNQISVIENLNHLTELRVLNLAGNQIEHVSNLAGMSTLAELNLRRNSIITVMEIDLLSSLQRLFLSFNNINKWEDIECLGESSSLCEISLDGNPIAADTCYKQIVLKNMPQLRQLDMKRITEDEKRVASVMLRKEEERKREVHKQAIAKEKKRLAINNAARQWEADGKPGLGNNKQWPENHEKWVAGSDKQTPKKWEQYTDGQRVHYQGSLSGQSLSSTARMENERKPSFREVGERKSSTEKSSWMNASKNQTKQTVPITSLDISDSYLAEIDGDSLQLFGPGALDSLDKNWGNQASTSVTTVTVQFIKFDDFCLYINKIRNRFPNAVNFIFKEVNLHSLQQINSLSQLKKIDSLTIESGQENPVTQFSLWKSYTLFRLSHLSLARLNGKEVTAADVVNAEKIFGALSLVTTSQLSQFRLVALLGENRQKVSAAKEQKKNKSNDDNQNTAVESVGRSGLRYLPAKTVAAKNIDVQVRKSVAKDIVTQISAEAQLIVTKQSLLYKLWPTIFVDLVKEAVVDMNDLETYTKQEYKKFEET